MNINFEYYKVFYVIAKNKNITKAANELNISQPAISRMLKTMEEQLNTKLFIRKTKTLIFWQIQMFLSLVPTGTLTKSHGTSSVIRYSEKFLPLPKPLNNGKLNVMTALIS